jgi:hypothetical protein
MHAFYKNLGQEEAAADIMVEMREILEYQKKLSAEARLEDEKRKEEGKKADEEEQKKKMILLLLLLRYKDKTVQHLLQLKVN